MVDISKDSLIIEITGDQDKVSALQEMLKDFGIKKWFVLYNCCDRGNRLIKNNNFKEE